ncbi:MAG: PRC-barrel domain-containing protein [Betaproteobacteria bacterium]
MFHKINDLRGDRIAARGGEIGRVDDVYFDDENWQVRYFVVDTGSWLSGRKVLISPASVDRDNSSDEALAVGLSRDQVEHSPSIDADKPVDRQYEEAYARYYGLPLYWAPPAAAGMPAVERSEAQARKLEEAARKARTFEYAWSAESRLAWVLRRGLGKRVALNRRRSRGLARPRGAAARTEVAKALLAQLATELVAAGDVSFRRRARADVRLDRTALDRTLRRPAFVLALARRDGPALGFCLRARARCRRSEDQGQPASGSPLPYSP